MPAVDYHDIGKAETEDTLGHCTTGARFFRNLYETKTTCFAEQIFCSIAADLCPDRARELSRTFIEPDFAEFNRERGYIPVHYITMTQYDASFEGVEIAFKPRKGFWEQPPHGSTLC